MKRNLLTLVVTIVLGASLASAQASRTWVSGVGDDANPCSRTAPCKTFAGAISKTAVGGEIDALDPGGFGALTITKAITIDGGGGQVASVLVSGTNGIVVAAQPADVVTIRNLRINGIASGLDGIKWQSGKGLIIENCFIFGFTQNGIDIVKSDGGNANIVNTDITNNSNAAIRSVNTTNNVSVTLARSRLFQNTYGVFAGDFTRMSVRDSEASANSNIGFDAQSSAGTAELNISNSIAANNTQAGVVAGGGTTLATVRITGVSVFVNNGGIGILVGGNGSVLSFGNNYNGGTGGPSAGTIAPQ